MRRYTKGPGRVLFPDDPIEAEVPEVPTGEVLTLQIGPAGRTIAVWGDAGASDYLIMETISNETDTLTTGVAKYTFRSPFNLTVIGLPRINLAAVSTSGNVTVDINKSGSSMFSTPLTIDVGTKTSVTAAVPAVVSNPVWDDDAEITVDVDSAGTGAKGLKLIIVAVRTNIQALILPLIGPAATLFPPSVALLDQAVTLGTIISTETLFVPTVMIVQEVTTGTISSGSTPFAPLIATDTSVTGGTIASTVAVTGPTVAAAIPLDVAMGQFNAPSSATTGTTCGVTGLSFQPKLVLLWMNGRGGAAPALDTTANGRAGFGVFTGTSNRLSWGNVAVTAQATTDGTGIWRNDCAMIFCGSGANNYRTLVVDSINSDGFTLSIGSTGNTALSWFGMRIWYLALGGSAITNVTTGTDSTATGTGNEAFTGLAFQPDGALFLTYNNTINTFTDGIGAMLGAATGASDQWSWWGASQDAVAAVNAYGDLRTGESEGLISRTLGNISAREALVSFDATGWTQNKLASFSHTYGYCAIKGPRMKAGTFTCASGGDSVSLGFQPRALLVMTNAQAAETGVNCRDDFCFAIGSVVSGSQHAALVFENDGDDPSTVATGHRDDCGIITVNSSKALNSQVAFTLTATGFDYTMPTSTLNGYPVAYMAFGDA